MDSVLWARLAHVCRATRARGEKGGMRERGGFVKEKTRGMKTRHDDEGKEARESRPRSVTGERRRVTKAPLIHSDCRAERMLNPQRETEREGGRERLRGREGKRTGTNTENKRGNGL